MTKEMYEQLKSKKRHQFRTTAEATNYWVWHSHSQGFPLYVADGEIWQYTKDGTARLQKLGPVEHLTSETLALISKR